MQQKAEIMDRDAINRALIRISHEITEKNSGADDLVIVGIKRRGATLARYIYEKIYEIEGVKPVYAELDTSDYRDDIVRGERKLHQPVIEVTGKNIILVDDVMFTGRTVRAAIDCLMDMGRPKCIRLAVLVDRGHRELPFRADYVGKNVPTSLDEVVKVYTDEFDGEQRVVLYKK